jgi:hypothetical protein
VQLPVSIRRTLGAGVVLAVLVPATAQAHVTRYASPTATATSGDCSAAMPCKIGYAVNGATSGDEVVVAPGSYAVKVALAPTGIDLHGVAGQAPPLLTGPDNLTGPFVLQAGGTLRHLTLRGTTAAQDTLVMDGGLAEDLDVLSTGGDGAKVRTADVTTVLRDSVVITESVGSGAAALKLREGGGGGRSGALAVRNVTAMAPRANAIRCEVGGGGVATLVNVIARGAVADVDASNGGGGCSASHSNLRPEASPQLVLGAGILSAEPLLADIATGDYRPQNGSPTIDAGVADAFTGAADPDGRARTVPDVGAFECCGEDPWPGAPLTSPPVVGDDVAPTPPVEPPVRGIPAPVLGETVIVAPGQGKVLVRRPGARRFRKLAGAALLPSGTVVDARRGRIRLTTALGERGAFQTGRFWGSRFQIRQSASGTGMTTLALRGGDFGRCPARASALARTSVVPRENPTTRRVVRSLWARDRGGRFRTHGNNSVATARGTAWVTRDRCDGTVTRVREGAVAVKDRRTGRTVVVRAGGSYLARR